MLTSVTEKIHAAEAMPPASLTELSGVAGFQYARQVWPAHLSRAVSYAGVINVPVQARQHTPRHG